jgi:hypothetical protein
MHQNILSRIIFNKRTKTSHLHNPKTHQNISQGNARNKLPNKHFILAHQQLTKTSPPRNNESNAAKTFNPTKYETNAPKKMSS